MAATRKLDCWIVDGVKIPKFFSKKCFESALRLKPESGDLFVVTYPKCGTTWMQNVVINILRRGEPLERDWHFFLASPFLDQLGAEDSENMMIRPGALKTHLPFEKVPWSDDAKYIYVARNPKDCCVSFYHHMRELPGYQFSDATFDEFFEMFVEGELEFGDYFDHLLSWYEQRGRPNVFFTTYEEMKDDLKKVVLEVSEFVRDDEARYLLENPDVLNRILLKCSFEEMKFLNPVINTMHHGVDEILTNPSIPQGRKHIAAYNAALSSGPKRRINFIRKGEIGGWKKVLTSDQNERMNGKIKMIDHCSEIMKLWSKIM